MPQDAHYDPYVPPASSELGYRTSGDSSSGGAVPAGIMESMSQTKPWVTFLAVLGFIFSGLMGIGGLAVLAAGKVGNLPGGFGLIYILMAVLYIFPSLYLLRYGASIRRLLDGAGMDGLVDAVARQKTFWRFVGILTAVVLALYAVVLLAVVAGALMRFR